MRFILTFLISFGLCLCVHAQSRTPTRTEVRERLEQELDRLELEGELEMLRLRQSYIAALDVLIERMESSGDDDGAAVARAERERVAGGALRPERVGGNLDLAMLMQAMQSRVDEQEKDLKRRRAELVASFQNGARQVAERMAAHGSNEAAASWREFAEEIGRVAGEGRLQFVGGGGG